MDFPLWALGPQAVTPAELGMLADAAESSDLSVSDATHRTRLRTARALARKGLLRIQQGAEAGWERDMWAGTLTCPGWNALWRARSDRHDPGCGGHFLPTGVCDTCGQLRRLDVHAWDAFLEETAESERAFLTGRTRLWCDEHGFARERDWTTDKTCRRVGGSPYHERIFYRV